MKRLKTCLLASLWAAAVSGGDVAAAGETPARLRVLKQGDRVWVRSTLSPTSDLVILMDKGGNRQITFNKTFIVPASPGAAITHLMGAKEIHQTGDDSTPWNLNGTYIGANHGCSDARRLTSPKHGLSSADLGSEWADEAGTKFYVMKIPDGDSVWVLSANSGQGDIWRFTLTVAGTKLKRTRDGAVLSFTQASMVQLLPSCRISGQRYLVDGKAPIADETPTECESFDIVETYDVINPASVLADVIAHPGRERDFVAPSLEAVVSNRVLYRFLPNGANVIHHTAEAQQDFNLGYMGFIQSATLARPAPITIHDYYIPKTLPFRHGGVDWDFRAKQNYIGGPPAPLYFSAKNKNVEDPDNLPDRFIHLLGRKEGDRTVYDVGFALGYSLIQGMTVPARRAANTGAALMLYSSAKSYPMAMDSKMAGGLIKAGTTFDCLAYRQYFWPGAFPNATCCYWHPEGDETVVYIGYHKPVRGDVLKLPAEFSGRNIRIIERTASLMLHSDQRVPADGLKLSVHGDHGALVIAIK